MKVFAGDTWFYSSKFDITFPNELYFKVQIMVFPYANTNCRLSKAMITNSNMWMVLNAGVTANTGQSTIGICCLWWSWHKVKVKILWQKQCISQGGQSGCQLLVRTVIQQSKRMEDREWQETIDVFSLIETIAQQSPQTQTQIQHIFVWMNRSTSTPSLLSPFYLFSGVLSLFLLN